MVLLVHQRFLLVLGAQRRAQEERSWREKNNETESKWCARVCFRVRGGVLVGVSGVLGGWPGCTVDVLRSQRGPVGSRGGQEGL